MNRRILSLASLLLALGCSGGDDAGDSGADAPTSTSTSDTGMDDAADIDDDTPDAADDAIGDAPDTGMDDATDTGMDDAPDTEMEPDTGSSSTGAPDDGVVTFDEVAPIFQGMCQPCHTGVGLGGHDIGNDDPAVGYADSQLDATAVSSGCTEGTIGACALIRIQNGSMPQSGGCSGDPDTDAALSQCLTQDQQDLIQAWIDDGQLPPV